MTDAVTRWPTIRAATAIGALLLWTLALPVAAAAVHSGGPPRWLALPVYGIGHLVCHQRPERSLHWAGTPWPVCARCTGIYLGLALGAGAALVRRRPPVPAAAARRLAGLAAVPTAATLAFEWTTGVMPSHATRLVSGVVIGAVLGHVVAALLGEPDPARHLPGGSGH